MKFLEKIRKPVVLVLCALLLTGTAYAAGVTTKNISVTYRNIKLVVDGAQVTPKDANGAVVEPFVYNGTTYLPVRAVGNAIGKQVSWDGNTNTVYIGANLGQKAFLMDVCPPYERSRAWEGTMTMSGKSYSHGYYMTNVSDSYAYFNLDGNYNTMEFDFGATDGCNEGEMEYDIYLDGQLVKTITHEAGEMVKHYTLPLNQALQMKIVGTGRGTACYYSGSDCGFANITLE